jgi:hypothetical protein
MADYHESAVPVIAQELVREILGDLEISMQRAAHFFKNGDEAMYGLFSPMALMAIGKAGLEPPKMAKRENEYYNTLYRGERRDLLAFTRTNNWVEVLQEIHNSHISALYQTVVNPGDYIRIPVKVPACRVKGLEFEELDMEAEAVVADVVDGKIIFQFEEILFFSAINSENTNKGGFKNSDLSSYLNDPFMTVFAQVKDCMVKNKHGRYITLPTKFEVFGEGDNKEGNWKDGCQLEHFKKIKNRIRVKDNDTQWWWLSTPCDASVAHFTRVSGLGIARYGNASGVGGCAPAFCIT